MYDMKVLRNILFYRFKNNVRIHFKVMMYDYITHSHYFPPRDFSIPDKQTPAGQFIQIFYTFTHSYQLHTNRIQQ